MSSEISPAEVNAPHKKKTKTTVHIPTVFSQEIEGVASEVAVDIGLAKLKPAKGTSLNRKGNLCIFQNQVGKAQFLKTSSSRVSNPLIEITSSRMNRSEQIRIVFSGLLVSRNYL